MARNSSELEANFSGFLYGPIWTIRICTLSSPSIISLNEGFLNDLAWLLNKLIHILCKNIIDFFETGFVGTKIY